MDIKLASWNVNGIRAVSAKEDWKWFSDCGYDVISLQETKELEMKKALQEIVRNRLTSVERIEAAESTMDGHDVLKAVLRADINNLQATLDEVDQDNFDQAVDMILSAKHIYIIGMRTSTTLADFLGIYLKLLLDNVTVVKEIAARENGITCSCGSKDYGMEIHSTYVDLVCKSCGAKLRIPAATDEDLDRLCCRMTLTIPGK